jgi:hypothetical protein
VLICIGVADNNKSDRLFSSSAALTVATDSEFPCGFAGFGGGRDALHPESPNPTVARLKAVLCDRSDGLNEMMLK